MLDAAFGETFDPETTTTFEGGSFENSNLSDTGKDIAVGDFNGDGYDDLLVLSGNGDGESKLIYGSADRTDMGDMTEADLDASNSVTFTGDAQVEQKAITFLGDINGDGYEDIAFVNPGDAAGEGVRVVLGSASPSATIDITDTSQSNVFYIRGASDDDQFGFSVAGGGDVNNDGYDDILIGSPTANNQDTGRGYVIFGHNGAFADVDLASDPLDGTDGFAIQGLLVGATGDKLGADVSAAGDFNGDGIDDFAISTTVRSGGDGAAFVIYGRDTGFSASMNINDLDATTGFSIYSDTVDDFGSNLEAAGDFNGDGFDDLAVSNYTSGSDKYAENDGVHIIYGSDSHPAELNTSDIDGTNGTYLRSNLGNNEFGIAMGAGADLDGDGFDDLVIGASGLEVNAGFYSAVFVIYGNNRGDAELLTHSMNSTEGTKIAYDEATSTGTELLGGSVAVGNFDGDAYSDIAFGDTTSDSDAGKVYYFYGLQGNTAPTVTSIADQTIMEDTSTGDIAFTINDVDGDTLSVEAVSSNTSLIPNGNIIINGTGDNRTVRVTPIDDRTGSATITITVEDARGSSVTESFDVVVNAGNAVPTISAIADQTIDEGTDTGALAFTVGDPNGDTVTISASSSNTTLVPDANIVVNGTGANRTVTVTPAANQTGTATVTISVDDGNGGITTETFDVTVDAVNTAPTISAIADQAIDEGTDTGALAFTVGDADGDALTISASSSNTTLVPDANIVVNGTGANRTVTVAPAANQTGTATVTISVDDGNGGITTETFDVSVNQVQVEQSTTSNVTDDLIALSDNTERSPEAFTQRTPITENTQRSVERTTDMNAAQGSYSLTVSNMNAENFNQTYYGAQFGVQGQSEQFVNSTFFKSNFSGYNDEGMSRGVNDQMIDIVTSVEQSMYGQDSDEVDAYLRYWDKLYQSENRQSGAGDYAPNNVEPSAGNPESGEMDGINTPDPDKDAHFLDHFKPHEKLTTKLTMHANEFDQSVERFIASL